MNNEFELILKRLNNSKISIIDLLGCYGIIISSKSMFNNNKEITNFLNGIFKIQLPLYITKSRTLMTARILRMIYADKDNDKKLENIVKETVNRLEEINKTEVTTKKSNNKRQQNENEKLEKWLKGL